MGVSKKVTLDKDQKYTIGYSFKNKMGISANNFVILELIKDGSIMYTRKLQATEATTFDYTAPATGEYTWRMRSSSIGTTTTQPLTYSLDNLSVFYSYPYTVENCDNLADGYRFGFNTQEKDDEVYGAGNLNTAEFWEYDTRIGRRWNVDPVVKDNLSSYSCFTGNPIINADPSGDDDFISTTTTNITLIKVGNETKPTSTSTTTFEVVPNNKPNRYFQNSVTNVTDPTGYTKTHKSSKQLKGYEAAKWLSTNWSNFTPSYTNQSFLSQQGSRSSTAQQNFSNALATKQFGDKLHLENKANNWFIEMASLFIPLANVESVGARELAQVLTRRGHGQGATAGLVMADGTSFIGISGSAHNFVLTEEMTGILMNAGRTGSRTVPEFFGRCAEVSAIQQARAAGYSWAEIRAASLKAYNIGEKAGSVKPFCPGCLNMLEILPK